MKKPKYQFQRIRFTWHKPPRNKLLDELAQYNNQLRQLLDSSDRLAVSRPVPKPKKSGVGNTLLRFWHYAKSLHALLRQGWCCNCKSLHYANLFLQHHRSHYVEFKIQFNFSQITEHPGPVRTWTSQETKISLAEDPQPTIDRVISASRATLSSPTTSRKSVTSLASDLQPVRRSVYDVGTTEITDLCTAIATTKSNCSCLGFLQDEEHRYNVYPLAISPATNVASKSVTLASLLDKTSSIALTRRQRYSIALILASSHLQLHATPWLETRWSKKDVFFLRSGNDSILLDQPHLIHELCGTSTPNLPASRGFSDRIIPTLGIMLLELCFGVALEDHHTRQNYFSRDGRPNAVLDLAAAMEWCSFANEEAGPEFADAIEWCLRNPTDTRASADIDDANWREEFYARVVEPLRYCHEQMTASTMEPLGI